MNILAIDTSSGWGSVAVAKEGHICYISYLDVTVTHSERLMLQIDNSLSQSNITLDDLDLIVFSNGPGSFTGLRIGLATIKGICSVKKIPLLPVNTLKALAFNVYGSELDILPFIDARMNEVYAALYDKNMVEKKAPQNCKPQEFLEQIDEPAFIIGDGVKKYQDLIQRKGAILHCGLIHQNFVIASSLIGLVTNEKIDYSYDFDSISDLEPYYLRSSQAEMNLQRRLSAK